VRVLASISRAIALVEVVALCLVALLNWAIIVFGLGGITGLGDALIAVALLGVSFGCMAGIKILSDHVRDGAAAMALPIQAESVLVLLGAFAATLLVVVASFLWSSNEQWSRGIDFARLGFILWAPVVHLGLLQLVVSANLRWSGHTASSSLSAGENR
jgi:hypothetical protein